MLKHKLLSNKFYAFYKRCEWFIDNFSDNSWFTALDFGNNLC